MLKRKQSEKNLALVSEMPNYNKWIFTNIQPYLGERILEIGCGIGNITQFLVDKKLLVGIDTNGTNLCKIKKKFRMNKNFTFFKKDATKKRDIRQLSSYCFDTVLCLNVLEHIKDDRRFLKQISGLLKNGGRIILLCPNYPWLFGTIDKADGHYRRYTKNDLINKVSESGFKIKKVFYMNVFGILGWILHSKILKRGTHVKSHFQILNYFSNTLMYLERIIKPPTGLSLIVIGTKNK